MFERSENPVLFDIVVKACRRIDVDKSEKNALNLKVDKCEKDGIIPDELLLKVDKILISNLNGVKSIPLYGIEKLVNLKSLTINGISEMDYFARLSTIDSDKHTLLEKAEKIKELREYFYLNQITNIAPIYKLKNLEVLELNDQRLIKEIDLSSMPKLRKVDMRRCSELKTIKGIDKLENINDGEKLYGINFSGCNKLNNIDNFDKFIMTLYENFNTYKEEKIVFPTTTYMFVENEYKVFKKIFEKDKFPYLPISWSEISTNIANVLNTTKQMHIAKHYIDNLVKTLCDKENSQIENVYNIYNWIANNIQYDTKNYEKIKDTEMKNTCNKDQTMLSNTLRSSFVALFDKKAICVGISNLLNAMLADIGVLTNTVNCDNHTIDSYALGNPFVKTTHQISSVIVDGYKYYLDPTFELNHKNGRYFLLTKEQLEATHALTIFDEKYKSGYDIHDEFLLQQEKNDLLNRFKFDSK